MSVPIAQITAVQLSHQLAGNQRPLLLDCREPDEWRFCRIQGARHIPMNQIRHRFGELDATRAIVVYCHHGVRSQAVGEFLARQGFSDVANLEGGIDAWSQLVDPDVRRY